MRSAFFWLLSFGGLAAVSLLCGLMVWPQLSAVWPSIEEKIDRYRRQPPLVKLVLLLFVGAFVVFGSTKTNQVDQVKVLGEGEQWNLLTYSAVQPEQEDDILCSPSPLTFTSTPPTVTTADIARGWQLWEVKTNSDICYTMPEGAMMASNWWVRGAYEDVKRIGLESLEWRFPFGTNGYDSAWAFSWGKLRFVLGDMNTEIVAVGAPMSAVPCLSRLWSAADTNGAKVVTWENFVLGRVLKDDVDFLTSGETPLPLCCAQIELRQNGDFVTRSNEVETVYRRVDPEDWDGDGWRNDDDSDPYCREELCDDFEQELPDGDDACNYCWIEIRPQWNSWIAFVGDGPSNLEDPCFWGKAGETYRVWLLIGKTYDVTSTQPLAVVGRSDEAIQVFDDEPCSFSVVWPVTFTVGEGRYVARPLFGATWNDGGKSFHVLHDPPFLRGTNVWWNGCCLISGDGTNYMFACDNACTCEGCTAYGSFVYSGYRLDLPGVFECGCRHVPDHGPAGVSISFDRPAVIYEEAYTNLPGEVVHPARTNAVLRCSVRGGTYGGTLSVTLNAAANRKLNMVSGVMLPQDVRIEPGTSSSYEAVYAVLEPSDSVRDIVASAVFHEDFLNVDHTNAASMTSVKVELTAVYEAPENPNPSRHIYGVGEKVNFKVTPQSSEITLKAVKADLCDLATAYDTFSGVAEVDARHECVYVCPAVATVPLVSVTVSGVWYYPSLAIVEPELIVTPSARSEGVFWPGQVGMGTLITVNYIGPMTVSFRGVKIFEVPCTNAVNPIGYFDSSNYTGRLTHDYYAGAGDLHPIDASNYWMTDRAGRELPYENWFSGRLVWNVPIGWRRLRSDDDDSTLAVQPDYEFHMRSNTRALLIGGSESAYKQIYTIGDDGTSSVEKFGYELSRSRWSVFGSVSVKEE